MKKLLQLKTMLLLCALIVGSGSSWADDVTFTAGTDKGSTSVTKDGVTVSMSTMSRDDDYRTYANSDMTVTSTAGDITKIVVTCTASGTSNYGPGKFSGTGYVYSGTTGTWSGSATSVSLHASAQVRMTKIVVTLAAAKSAIGTFDDIDDMDLSLNDMTEFDPSVTFNKAGGATGEVTFTVTPGDGESSVAYYEDGYILSIGEGEQEFTVKAIPAVADASSFDEATTKFTVSVTDNRTAVGTMTAISPTTVYVGAIDNFSLTQSMISEVASYSWNSSDDTKIEVSGGSYEAKATGDVTISVTATPTNTTTYKPVTANFEVTVAYKYTAPTISKNSGEDNNFTGSTTVTIGAVSGATVYYTIDGTDPSSSSTVYSESFNISETVTIKAIAIDGDGCVSPMAEATYTRVPEVHTSIALAAGQTLSFTDFSGAGAYADNKSFDVIASDGDKYTWTGKQFMSYNKNLQMKSGVGVFTSGTITSPNGFKMILKFTNDKMPSSVKAGETTLSGTSTGTNELTYDVTSISTAVTINANSSNAMYVKEITLKANKAQNNITATTAYNIDRTNDESSITLDATSTSGSVTYTLKSCTIDSEDYSFNSSTGELTVSGTYSGVIVITASSEETSSYLAAEDVDITITIIGDKADPTIIVSDDEVAYGEDYVLDISGFASGAVSISSSNTNVATVNNETLTVTPVSVGTTTITVNTAESSLYNAGSETFDLTVIPPVGGTQIQKGVGTSTATLDFTDNTKWEFPSSSDKGISERTFSDGTYSIKLKGTSGNGYGFNSSDNYLILGQNGATLTFQTFDKFVTQIDVTGRSGASGYVKQNIYVGSETVSTETTGATGTNEYVIADAYQAPGNIYKLQVTNAYNTQITSIEIHFADVATASATIASSGYGTFCYEHPLNLDELDAAAKAYVVTNVSDKSVTFSNITGTIKGGVPFILYGTSGAYSIPTATSTTVPASNMLKGTLAPTYVTTVEGDYTNFGLSGGEFKKITSGVVPANKAYLPVLTDELPASGRLSIVFEEEETGIKSMRDSGKFLDNTVYNLRGQRVENPTKGLYIVNGRKVVVK